jgi:glycosyltransferase involved in cell wall biosynthesis
MRQILNSIKNAFGGSKVDSKPKSHHRHEDDEDEEVSLEHVRALFILKRREDYSTDIVNFQEKTVATGMWNSARYVVDALRRLGANAEVVVVTDNNCIDREVTQYKATHVFVEGYWVVPEKFDVLKPLHKGVKWIVRCHSEIPFLAQEGIAFKWTEGYLKRGIYVAGNSPRNSEELRIFAAGFNIPEEQLPMLPNSYPVTFKDIPNHHLVHHDKDVLDISCFGAVRPLKNHLAQAIAAYAFARSHGKRLRFHINAGRVELQGANALKNLISFFEPLEDAELVQHPWCNFDEFIEILRNIDVSMQVSFTETFNIVTADALYAGTPVVVSQEVPFVEEGLCDPTSLKSMLNALHEATHHQVSNVTVNRSALSSYVTESALAWYNWLKK